MDCRLVQAQIEAYLDNELERAEARELEAHVDGCAHCRALLTRLDDLRRALREPALRHTAPDDLRVRIAESAADLREPTARLRRHPSWLRYAAACLISFGAGGLAVHMWNSVQTPDTQLSHDVFAAHWRALAANSPVDVVSSDRHTVKPWFAGKVAQAPLVQDFAEQGFPLVGGRLDYVGHQRVPVLVYRHDKHLIDVFVLPADGGDAVASVASGYRIAPVRVGGEPAAVVSDLDETELAKFERLLAQIR